MKTTGDGFLVEFASVVEAVRCAVELQSGMAERNAAVANDRRLEVRIGVNVGDIVEPGGDLFGDGVNIVARLEGLAEPGGIVISGNVGTMSATGSIARSRILDEQTLKNIAQPIRGYRRRPGHLTTATAHASPPPGLPDKPSLAVLPRPAVSPSPAIMRLALTARRGVTRSTRRAGARTSPFVWNYVVLVFVVTLYTSFCFSATYGRVILTPAFRPGARHTQPSYIWLGSRHSVPLAVC